MNQIKKIGLLPRLIIGIGVGILIGWVAQDVPILYPIMVLYATFHSLFGSLLTFSIPMIILGFIIPGIAQVGKGAGKMLPTCLLFATTFTLTAGFFAYFITVGFSSFIVTGGAFALGEYRPPAAPITVIPIAPVMPTMTALIFSFVVGISLLGFEDDNVVKQFFMEFRKIIQNLVGKVVVPLLPIHISAIFANMAYIGQAGDMVVAFFATFVLILAMHWTFLMVVYSIAGVAYKRSPFSFIRKMLPSYMTAVGTMSSAATIPVNLINVKRLGVKESVADMVVPLGATINLPGSTMSIVACTIVVMYMYGMDVGLHILVPFIFALSILMIAAPGVPGGAIVAAFAALEGSLGFNEVQLGIMAALYFAQDSLGTAVNVTSDGAMSLYIHRLLGHETLETKA